MSDSFFELLHKFVFYYNYYTNINFWVCCCSFILQIIKICRHINFYSKHIKNYTKYIVKLIQNESVNHMNIQQYNSLVKLGSYEIDKKVAHIFDL